MSIIYDTYEPVIGIEVHVQLSTQSKAYCGDATAYGASPNTQVSPISLGHPGTLPMFNKAVMNYAVKLGIACDCKIRERNEFARKNYFYADLPKGYQVTQDTTPICTEGFVRIKDAEGNDKKINLTRIHMEEDSGKSIHDIDPFNTLVDLNRAGIPLLEIVSEPEIKNGEEAYSYFHAQSWRHHDVNRPYDQRRSGGCLAWPDVDGRIAANDVSSALGCVGRIDR